MRVEMNVGLDDSSLPHYTDAIHRVVVAHSARMKF